MRVTLFALTICLLITPAALAQRTQGERPTLVVPRMTRPPELSDFLDMAVNDEVHASMARIEGFVQRWPADGEPERWKTVAYVGYTADALHVVYLAFDPEPSALRAHLVRREEVFRINDDAVELRLDTFGDRRQSYYFVSNPLGVQLDASWPEFEGQYDESFDVLWHSRGERTSQGFVVWMAVPFRSLRFRENGQPWGIYLGRWMPRSGEWTFWPRVSIREQSFLTQMARLEGIADIYKGRGLQVIPYASNRSFQALDAGSPGGPAFVRDNVDSRAGVDVKAVLRDAVVLDVTANPDFSQVESDAPQITANQRYEVFFPEKRPFFLENAGFFQTPVNLLFTRRVADPAIGARLTGKMGPWTVGVLGVDDEAPGRSVNADDPRRGTRAWAGVARASRSLFGGSTVGGLVTRRAFGGRENLVASVDGQARLGGVWTTQGQWVVTRFDADGQPIRGRRGTGYQMALARNGRTVSARTEVGGRSRDFVTELGFVPRVDVHEASQSFTYTARPARLVADWGPTLLLERAWAFDGTPLDWRVRPSLEVNMRRATGLAGFADFSAITLRPGDAPALAAPVRLRPDSWGVNARTSPTPAWSASLAIEGGRAVNFAPPALRTPSEGGHRSVRAQLALRPLTPLRIENTWLTTSLEVAGGRAFATDIVRSQWAWQFTREWSLRFIGQYEHTRSDPARSAVIARRNLNGDVLLTRLINPWSALYVGYNGNARSTALVEGADGRRTLRAIDGLARDSWQLFVKWSYLLQW